MSSVIYRDSARPFIGGSQPLTCSRLLKSLSVSLLGALCWFASPDVTAQATLEQGTVVFVCEHGSVKSVIAAALFEASTKKEGLRLHAIARGRSPDDRVPDKIVTALRSEGVDVSKFRPRPILEGEMRDALRVVAIGIDVTPLARNIEVWNDIPSSDNYPAARDAIQRRVDELLIQLRLHQPGLSARATSLDAR